MGDFKITALDTLVVAFLHLAMFTPNLNSPPLPSNPPLLPTYPKQTMQVEQKKHSHKKHQGNFMPNMQSIPSMPKPGSYPIHVPMHKGRARRLFYRKTHGT